MLPTPLQVILCHKDGGDTLRRAIQSGFRGQGTGYLSGGDDLNVPIRRLTAAPPSSASALLSGPLHTLLVVLIDKALTEDTALLQFINDASSLIEQTDPQNALLLIDIDGSFDAFCEGAPDASWSQAIQARDLGEDAVQSTVATLIALNLATQAVTRGTALVPDKLQFFVSHAKIDGQPLARTLADQIKRLPGFAGFYDADDIAPGTNWKKVLQQGVQDSVLIVLRSKAFEGRVWCLQEVHWAEEFGSPIVVVDLLHDLIHPPSQLNLGQNFSIRVPDGNIYRIIFIALREGLRARLHFRTVQAFVDTGILPTGDLRVLVRRPTMLSLFAACKAMNGGTIVYPDPALSDGEFHAAAAIVAAADEDIALTTPQTIMADPSRGGLT
ncbi:toll/interleukin-1 receptor domain-containing protein [Tateyamaria armeniaca]|uniref:Toll/interleukin-1 receptor domain-containing protein n=1 Tax=Tateyamaria armeniaca TaxID=2518930 RepID=A0ABW8UN43_9RHOB